MKTKALAYIQKHGMFQQGDRLLAAVSGGADSVALLHFLCALRDSWGVELGALHLNHQLRGAESERDEAFVRDLCAAWNVELELRRANVAGEMRRSGLSLEQSARACRYRFFDEMAAGKSAKVATAHTLSDNVETVLLNLTRGTALRGLCGIPPVRGAYVRPLLDCTRAEVEAYCAAHSLAFVDDSTNAEPFCARNRLRHEAVPLLERENPALAVGIAGMTELLRQDADYLDALAAERYRQLRAADGLDLAGLRALPRALQGRVLCLALNERGIAVSRERVERLRLCALGEPRAVQLDAEWVARPAGGCLVFAKKMVPQPPFCVQLSLEEAEQGLHRTVFTGKTVRIRTEECQNLKQNDKNYLKVLKNAVDCDKMGKIIQLRQRRQRDSLRLQGRGHAKTLKNLFQEAGIGPDERARSVVLADEFGVKWVEGFGPDVSAAVGAHTEKVLIVETMEDDDAR